MNVFDVAKSLNISQWEKLLGWMVVAAVEVYLLAEGFRTGKAGINPLGKATWFERKKLAPMYWLCMLFYAVVLAIAFSEVAKILQIFHGV